jgi:hypothetical protein
MVTRMDVVIALLEIARETSLDARDGYLTLALFYPLSRCYIHRISRI